MQNITSSASLRTAIQFLEVEQTKHGQLLKQQLLVLGESLKPVNLLRHTFNDISSSPNLADNIIGISTGLVSGLISNRIITGRSANIIRKLIGSVMQYGVTSVVANHPEAIKVIGKLIFEKLRPKRAINPEKP